MHMPRTPYFSIVIPTYNRGYIISRTIASVLAQEDPDFEVIVVDDGSTDDTEAVVGAIIDERVRYYRKENAERGAARNYGAARAQGSYINFFDSDDLLYPHHLTSARRLIEQEKDPEFVYLAFEMKDEDGKLLRRGNSLSGDLGAQLVRGNRLSCNGVFLRRDIALQFPFNEDLVASEDWELWLRLAARYRIRYSNEITSVLVNHEQRSELHNDEQALLKRKELMLRYLFEDKLFVERFGDQRKYIEHEFLSFIALHLALAGQSRRACKYLKDSVWLWPSSIFQRRFLAVVKHIIFK